MEADGQPLSSETTQLTRLEDLLAASESGQGDHPTAGARELVEDLQEDLRRVSQKLEQLAALLAS